MNNSSHFTIAQISDCHLFSDKNALFHGHNVYQNLLKVLVDITKRSEIAAVVFTGDLSQDHSEASYQCFVDAINESQLTYPLFYLAGNHDDPSLMDNYLRAKNIDSSKQITFGNWQLLLVDSKSATPAGFISKAALAAMQEQALSDKHQFVFSHHHALDVGYFIDRHGLENQREFWQALSMLPSLRGLGCGHVHRAMTLYPQDNSSVALYTCPATSIQFDPDADTVVALAVQPGYRLFKFYDDGAIVSEVIRITE